MQAGVELSDRGHRQDQEMSTRGFDQGSHGNGKAANVTKALEEWIMTRLGIFKEGVQRRYHHGLERGARYEDRL